MGNLKFSIFFTLIVVFALKAKGWDLVKKEQRRSIVETEYGQISAVDVDDRSRNYHLQFFTLDPNAIFLPVLLHADMVLHVKTGSGRLYWTPGDEETTTVSLQKGDIYRVPPGSIFFLKSDLQPEREKLRIHAIFANSDDDIQFSSIGAYSSVTDMVRGFDKNILQAAFKAPEEVIEALLNSTVSSIVHSELTDEKKLVQLWDWEISFLKALGGGRAYRGGESGYENKKKKKQKGGRTFNVFKEKADFENCNGWSLTVTKSDLHSLKQSNFGVFYVNLTKGSMMGPHWNPQASEIAMVVEGQGMVRVVCANNECKNTSFRVKEGDVFVIPRFHPMAQMSFNNDSLVFIGFTTSTKRNYPQFLAGKASVLQVLDKNILATAFQVSNSTITDLLAPQEESVILECTSCAEDEEMKVEEEVEREREREREKEEKRRREEEAEREREEEEKERQEEEKRRKEEEARKREEEAEKERQEEEKRKRKEEEARKREEEEREREREEEEKEKEARKREEEEAEREREEEEARKREEEAEREEEEARKREEEAEREKEEARKREEEAEREKEEEEARKREEEARKREDEEARKREEEEARKREEEEARKREEEEAEKRKREEEGEKEKGEETEEEAARREEEERIRREEEEDEKRKKIERKEEGEARRVLRKLWKV